MVSEINPPKVDAHDLSLPAWGPYTKKYNGVAHIPNLASGLRFDLSIFPGYYRRMVNVPHSKWESGFHPWEASPGLEYFSYRYDLEWKDNLYCDVAYFSLSDEPNDSVRGIRVEFVNNTDLPQHQVLHYMAYMNFPPVRPYSEEPILPGKVDLPTGAIWIDGLDYDDLGFAKARPSDNLVYEGWHRGEVRDHGFVNGGGIGCEFGQDIGDWVSYTIDLPFAIEDAALWVRYRSRNGTADFDVSGIVNGVMHFPQADQFAVCEMAVGSLATGNIQLRLTSLGTGSVELDGFVVVAESQKRQVIFSQHRWNPVPQIEPGPSEKTVLLKYDDVQGYYGIAWGGEPSEIRQYFANELDRTLRYFVVEHVQRVIGADESGHFTNVFFRPIVVEPHSRVVLFGLVCYGSEDEVRQRTESFDPNSGQLEAEYNRSRQARAVHLSNPSGEGYLFSQERMAATLLTNVVYPVYTRRQFIRHFTPGKWWDCLYTWDSGFISLGLVGVDLARAIDCLNAYITPVGDLQAAFIHHGSPVLVQLYAFHELWNQTRSMELLRHFYPSLRQAYLFMAGRLGSSTTRHMRSNLLKTWDYFYNSAGWDDYPPQVYVHRNQLEATVTPVVTTAHQIRGAKILQLAARALGFDEDVLDYQTDIDVWQDALTRYSWDAVDGTYSYVVHDDQGVPIDILRHPDGQNLNLGLDGLSPFFAGACDLEQEKVLYERMTSEDHFWTPVGLVSVDHTAVYYRADGYWNGCVWFPYQWFIWKSLLDLGYGDFAFKIARTALDVWKLEVESTYNCYEHIVVSSRRGSGWHQFGGLSTPILAWFSAYHKPGTLTCGHETWIESVSVGKAGVSLNASLLRRDENDMRPWLVLAVLAPETKYWVDWNGTRVPYSERYSGTLEISLWGSGVLEIRPQE
jgi:hypothetical protein